MGLLIDLRAVLCSVFHVRKQLLSRFLSAEYHILSDSQQPCTAIIQVQVARGHVKRGIQSGLLAVVQQVLPDRRQSRAQLPAVYGSEYFPFIVHDYTRNIDRVFESYTIVTKQINDIDRYGVEELNKVVWGEGIPLRDYQSITINSTHSNYPLSPDFSQCIPIQLNNMIKMQRVFKKQTELIKIGANWTKAQARPFFVNELAVVYQNFVFVIVNSYNSVLSVLESSQRRLFDVILVSQVENYDKNYLIFVIVLTIVTALNCIEMSVIAVLIANRLARFYGSYLFMKSSEIDMHCEFYEHKRKLYEDMYPNEVVMVTDFIQSNWAIGSNTSQHSFGVVFGSSEKRSSKNPHVSNQISITRLRRFKRDKIQISPMYLQVMNLGYALFIILLVLLSLSFNSMSARIISFQRFFMKTNNYIIEVNKSLQSYILYTNFGNYIKMDGDWVSQDKYYYAVENFIHYFSSYKIQHKDLLQDRYEQIADYLESNLCQHIDEPNTDRRAQVYSICAMSQRELGFSGLNSFLLVQNEQLQRIKTAFDSTANPANLENSKTKFVAFSTLVFMESTFARIRYIHYLALDTLTSMVGQVVLSRIQEINLELTNLLSSIQIGCTLVLGIYATICTVIGLRLIKMDHDLATETFRAISPWVLTNNPYILNLLKEFFSLR